MTMIRNGILTVATFVSVVLFPWPFTAFLAVVASFVDPLVPIAAGLFADTLYYAPGAGSWPIFTLYGLILSAFAFFVRSRLRASSM